MQIVFFIYKALRSINEWNIFAQQIFIIVGIVRKNIFKTSGGITNEKVAVLNINSFT